MYLKPNNADKDLWLRTQPANQKLKQNAQTQGADDMQGLPMLFMKKLKAISQLYYGSWEDEGNGSEPPAPLLPLELQPRDMHRPKTKTVWHFPLPAPCAVFPITSHVTFT